MTAPEAVAVAGGVTSAQVSAAALGEASRRVQAQLRAQLARDVVRAWPALDPKRLDRSWPGWLRVMSVLLRRYHVQTGTAAGAYYRAVRTLQVGEAPLSVVKLADPPSDAWLERALGFAGPGKVDRYVQRGFSEQQAAVKALSTVQGTAQRVALDGQRTTILQSVDHDRVTGRPSMADSMRDEQKRRDEAASAGDARWYRLTDGNPCAFCALLASRSAIYRSNKTVAFNRDDRFTNTTQFGAHNDCGCTAAVSFTGQPELTGVAAKAHDIYFGMKQAPEYDSGKSLLQNFRAMWATYGPASEQQPDAAAA